MTFHTQANDTHTRGRRRGGRWPRASGRRACYRRGTGGNHRRWAATWRWEAPWAPRSSRPWPGPWSAAAWPPPASPRQTGCLPHHPLPQQQQGPSPSPPPPRPGSSAPRQKPRSSSAGTRRPPHGQPFLSGSDSRPRGRRRHRGGRGRHGERTAMRAPWPW